MKKLLILLLSLLFVISFTFIACDGDKDKDKDTGDKTDAGEETDEGEEADAGKIDKDKDEETETSEIDIRKKADDSEDTAESESTDKATITFMVGGAATETPFIEQIANDFMERNPNIKVDLILGTTDTGQRKQAIVTAMRGKQANPDVFLMDIAWIGQLAQSNWLTDLSKYDVDVSPFYKSIIEKADTVNGKLVGLPVYVDGGLLYYRKDLLEKYGYDGPPQTWDDLVEMAKVVQEGERAEGNKDFWGFVWQGKQYEGLICNALETFTSAGGGFINKEGEAILNSEENKKALNFMKSLIHEHEVSPKNTYTDMTEEEVRRAFHYGSALFERNWPYAWGSHTNDEDSVVKDKFGVAPLPKFEGNESASTLGGWHIGISEYSDQKKASVEFVKYFTSPDVQKFFAFNTGWNPSRVEVYKDEEVLERLPHFSQLKDVFQGAVPRPSVPYYAEMSDVMQKYFNEAISGSIEIDAALKSANEEVSQIISENQ